MVITNYHVGLGRAQPHDRNPFETHLIRLCVDRNNGTKNHNEDGVYSGKPDTGKNWPSLKHCIQAKSSDASNEMAPAWAGTAK